MFLFEIIDAYICTFVVVVVVVVVAAAAATASYSF